MKPRVLALTRTSNDEDAAAARSPFEGLADVELIDAQQRNASALIARLGADRLPAWLYPLGEGMVVAVGSPEPLIERLRSEAARPELSASSPEKGGCNVVPRFEKLVAAALAQMSAAHRDRVRMGRAEVIDLIDERAGELRPGTQTSRLVRGLDHHTTLTRRDTSESQ